MKLLYIYRSTEENVTSQALLQNFIDILPDLMKILNNVAIVGVKINGDNVFSKEVNYFLDKEKANYLLVDESLSQMPIEKVVLKKGMTHKQVLKAFGFAAV
jgi:hypothetical protein